MSSLLERLVRTPWLPFELRARLYWRELTGTWIARRPETFDGKVQWRLAKDRRPLLSTFVNRVAMRAFVEERVGAEHLPACLAVVPNARELDRAALPREFVAKSSHGSGGMWLVTEHAAPEPVVRRGFAVAPGAPFGWDWIVVRPDRLDWDQLVESFDCWLAHRYEHVPEWAYQSVPPRIVVEEVLRAPAGGQPEDYKFCVFDGVVRMVSVDTTRYVDQRRTVFDRDWNRLPVVNVYRPADEEPPRPPSLEKLVEVAEALGSGIDFVRVDLYDLADRVIVGELTVYPFAGTGSFVPESYDLELGSYWRLPRD